MELINWPIIWFNISYPVNSISEVAHYNLLPVSHINKSYSSFSSVMSEYVYGRASVLNPELVRTPLCIETDMQE
jgi:hypothetical protein